MAVKLSLTAKRQSDSEFACSPDLLNLVGDAFIKMSPFLVDFVFHNLDFSYIGLFSFFFDIRK
jgi:hypothetical protein